jgi:hypothetical protein
MPLDALEQIAATGGDGRRMPAEFAPVMPLLAVAGLVALPYDLAVNDGGGLDFAWQPSQSREDVLTDPVVRVTVRHGSAPDGAGWIISSYVKVTGDEADKIRWCGERNAALCVIAGGPAADSGWVLAAGGTCCLTTRFTPGDLADEPLLSATLLADALRTQQDAVLSAVLAAPASLTNSPLHPQSLAAGLSRVASVFRSHLEYPPGYLASVSAGEAGVIVTLEGFCTDWPRGATGRDGLAELPDGSGSASILQPCRTRTGVRGTPVAIHLANRDPPLVRPRARRVHCRVLYRQRHRDGTRAAVKGRRRPLRPVSLTR